MDVFWILFFLIPFAAGQTPDYDKPYAPIIFDQEEYSWTEKVKITILAPSWNSDRDLIDDIGDDVGHFIKISTRGNSIEPYRLTETDVNNGIFTGEVILTGFSHDVDGDGVSDTLPRTLGTGPTSGFLETDRDSALTVSFEFADGVVVTESVPISWNIATMKFLESTYDIEQNAIIRIVDADMNLNPEGIDQVIIDVYSDSDVAGLEIEAIETNEDSGMFLGDVYFTFDQESSGNRLFSTPGDMIYAKYEDRTLPIPYSVSEELDILSQTRLVSNVDTSYITINDVNISDSFGKEILEITQNQQIQILGQVSNNQTFAQNFIYFVQIKDENQTLLHLSWITGIIQPSQSLDVSQSWIPSDSGNYFIESYVWESISSMTPLSLPLTKEITVQ